MSLHKEKKSELREFRERGMAMVIKAEEDLSFLTASAFFAMYSGSIKGFLTIVFMSPLRVLYCTFW